MTAAFKMTSKHVAFTVAVNSPGIIIVKQCCMDNRPCHGFGSHLDGLANMSEIRVFPRKSALK